jgi:hypothetical protein
MIRHHWVELFLESTGNWIAVDPLLGEFGMLDASHIRLPGEGFTVRGAEIANMELREPAVTRYLKDGRIAPPCGPESLVTMEWTRLGERTGTGESSFEGDDSGWVMSEAADIDGEFAGNLTVSYSREMVAEEFSYEEAGSGVKHAVSGRVYQGHVELVSERSGGREEYRYELQGPLLVAGNYFPRNWLAGLSRFDLEPGNTFPLDVLPVGDCRILHTRVQVISEPRGKVVELRSGGRVWYRLRLDSAGKLMKFENLPAGLVADIGEEQRSGGGLFEE